MNRQSVQVLFLVFLTSNSIAKTTLLSKEQVPLNQIELKILEADERQFFSKNNFAVPPHVLTTRYKNQQYAIRVIAKKDMGKYILPGDLFVEFTPVLEDAYPINLITLGARHAGIVVTNGSLGDGRLLFADYKKAQLCHIDAPIDKSSCFFQYDGIHFFRMNSNDPLKEADKIAALAGDFYQRTYNFDRRFKLEISSLGINDLAKKMMVQHQYSPDFYCSELPYTVFSMVLGKKLFEPYRIGQMIDEYIQIKDSGKYKNDLTDPEAQRAFILYLKTYYQLTNEEVKRLNDIFAAYLNPKTKSLAKEFNIFIKQLVTEFIQGPMIFPWMFVHQSKQTPRNLIYVGTTLENNMFQ